MDDATADNHVVTRYAWCDECQRDTLHTRAEAPTTVDYVATFIWLCAEHP